MLSRAEVRELKAQKLGKFIASGKFFMFSRRHARKVAETTMHDVPATAKTILAFIKTSNNGDKLHYEIPMAGDRSLLARHTRPLIHVSGRNLFRHQLIPA